MNVKRLVIAIIVGFVYVFATDFLIHAVGLGEEYGKTKELWRPEAEMQARMPLMSAGQFLAAATFVLVWALGFAERGTIGLACLYGLLLGLFSQSTTLIMYVVQPLPQNIATAWFVSGLVQSALFGVVTHFVYKPKGSPTQFATT